MSGRMEYQGGKGSLRRINVPVPNRQLEEWLMGSECRTRIENITTLIYSAYVNYLPASEFDPKVPGSGERNLKRGAYYRVGLGHEWGYGTRWFGYVGNNALSYRKTRNKPYPRYIEYGKPTKGIPGRYDLANAVNDAMGGEFLMPGVTPVPQGRGSQLRGAGGRFIANTMVETKSQLRRRRPQPKK